MENIMETDMIALHFECGFRYGGKTDRDTMNKMADYYFHRFMSEFRDFEWCDVIVRDLSQPLKDLGACRNPPPLPHNQHICQTCIWSETINMNGEDKYLCYKCDTSEGQFVDPESGCADWAFNESIY